MPRLELRALAIRHVGPANLTLEPGACLGLTGPSGAGKTLLLRAAADLAPHIGDCVLDAVAASAMPPADWRRRVGYLAAESAWWHDTVAPHFPAVDTDALAALGFDEAVLGYSIARLSSGERQRLALLRLLIRQPRALLLDEPTTNLDADNITAVERLLADYRATHAAPVLWVAHDAGQLARVAGRVARLDLQGRVTCT